LEAICALREVSTVTALTVNATQRDPSARESVLAALRAPTFPNTRSISMLSRMSCRSRAHVLAFSLVASFANVASASEWYVDAVNGSNANNGSSPSTAWRTITHAVANVPIGAVETINIAAGTYNQALGESFPIRLKPGQQLIGAPGAERPALSATNSNGVTLIRFESLPSQPLDFGPESRVERLDLRRAGAGIDIVAHAGRVSPTIVDVRLERLSVHGISIDTAGAVSEPTLERVETRDCQLSVVFHCLLVTGSGPSVVTARDCSFTQSSSTGVTLWGPAEVRLERCNFDTIADAAIWNLGGASTRVACSDSVIAYGGWAVESNGGDIALARCTIANMLLPISLQAGALELDHCIAVASGAVVAAGPTASVTATRSLISDGSFDGVNGCFSGDPGFRNGADGDFRLRWGSPCIDAAFVSAPAGASDVIGTSRELDGNLDTLGKTDLGAYEFQPLELTTTGAIGSTLRLENWGPNTPSTIYWARAGLAGSQSTPFGAFQLDPQLARVFRFTTAGAATPAVTLRPIPNQIALVGHTFSFQALTDSPAAPLAKAFTNGTEFTVTP
jgi:hypothetical protein